MSKKHKKKKLNQKLKRQLQQRLANPQHGVQAPTPISQPAPTQVLKKEDIKETPIQEPTALPPEEATNLKYLRTDLRRTGLILLAVVVIIILIYVISLKTDWLNLLGNHIFKFFHLSS